MIYILLLFLSYLVLWIEKESVRTYGNGYRCYDRIINNLYEAPERYRVLIPYFLQYILRINNRDFKIGFLDTKEIILQKGKDFNKYYIFKFFIFYGILLFAYNFFMFIDTNPIAMLFIFIVFLCSTFFADSPSSLIDLMLFGAFMNGIFYGWPLFILFFIVVLSSMNRESTIFMPIIYFVYIGEILYSILFLFTYIVVHALIVKWKGHDPKRIKIFFDLKRRFYDLKNTYTGWIDMRGEHEGNIIFNMCNIGYIIVFGYFILMFLTLDSFSIPIQNLIWTMGVFVFSMLIPANIWETKVFYPCFYLLTIMIYEIFKLYV